MTSSGFRSTCSSPLFPFSQLARQVPVMQTQVSLPARRLRRATTGRARRTGQSVKLRWSLGKAHPERRAAKSVRRPSQGDLGAIDPQGLRGRSCAMSQVQGAHARHCLDRRSPLRGGGRTGGVAQKHWCRGDGSRLPERVQQSRERGRCRKLAARSAPRSIHHAHNRGERDVGYTRIPVLGRRKSTISGGMSKSRPSTSCAWTPARAVGLHHAGGDQGLIAASSVAFGSACLTGDLNASSSERGKHPGLC